MSEIVADTILRPAPELTPATERTSDQPPPPPVPPVARPAAANATPDPKQPVVPTPSGKPKNKALAFFNTVILGLVTAAIAIYAASFFQSQLWAAADSLAGGTVTPAGIETLSLLGAMVMTAIALLPVMFFVQRGWGIKREDVMSSFAGNAIDLYVRTFLPNNKTGKPETIFNTMYIHRYGLYRLFGPVFLLAVTLFPLSLLVSRSALVKIAGPTPPPGTLILPGQALAAITGAYAFVVAGLVRGALTYNLPPVTLVNAALRLLVAAPLGYAVAVFGVGKSEFLAFAIGAFPLDQFQIYFRRWAGQLINQGLTNPVADDSADQALALDGIDQSTSEALADCQITTVLQLAYCDPVQLSLGTNIDFDVIIDLQSEALAYIYLGTKLDSLRPLGLRGAVEISNLMARETIKEGDFDNAAALPSPQEIAEIETKQKGDFDNAFKAAMTATALTEGGLRNCFKEIAGDPYTQFLAEIWHSRKK